MPRADRHRRLFLLLDQIDPQPRWQHAVGACLQALREAVSRRCTPGTGTTSRGCCGTAGVGQLLLDRYQATGDPALLAWATRWPPTSSTARSDPHGVAWSNTEHTGTPPDLPPEPGLMQGAAGIAGWLARLQALRNLPGALAGQGERDPSWL